MPIKLDDSKLLSALDNAQARAKVSTKIIAQNGALKFQNYAKQNRPWTDRTGHARQRLTGYVEDKGDKIRVCISHGVNYGKYLEFAHERRFAILERTINVCSKEVVNSFKTLLQNIR